MKQKHTKHKITPAIQRHIYDTAKRLPAMGKYVNGKPVYKMTEVPGTEVKKEDLKPGQPLIPAATYRINKLVYVNHVLEMINLVRRDGPGAIPIYEADCKAQLAMFKKDHARQNSFINKLINKLPWIKTKK